jgi:transposase
VAAWHAPATGKEAVSLVYSAIAIETGLALRLVFHQPLRQTQGLLRSIVDALGIAINAPDHTTLSRRGGGLAILPKRLDRGEPLHLLVDSTGLKICEGELLAQKHSIRTRRRWRKLHLGIDAVTHEIVASEPTPDVGDVSEIPDLLDQIGVDVDVVSLTADGAYDGEAVYDAVAERHPKAAVIIPPRSTAISSETTTTQRDRHLAEIAKRGRTEWRRRSGYNRRGLVETTMFRYKAIIGRRLQARTLPNQRTEAKIGATCSIG